MDFFEVLSERSSVREYTEDRISEQDITKIVDAGRLACTARNEQPWHFITVTDKKTIEKIISLCPNGVFARAAACLIFVYSVDTKYYLEDCSAATQNMLLAVTALGLGGCWIAGDKKDYVDEISKILGVPSGHKLVSLISVGKPAGNVKSKSKKGLSEVLHKERW